MPDFEDARDALARAVKKVFPKAKREPWRGNDGWSVPRSAAAIARASSGTYDPTRIIIAIADRKSGPVVYLLDPGDYDILATHEDLLGAAGITTGRGCIYPKKGAPFPASALEELFRRVKARDEAGAVETTRTKKRKGSGAKRR